MSTIERMNGVSRCVCLGDNGESRAFGSSWGGGTNEVEAVAFTETFCGRNSAFSAYSSILTVLRYGTLSATGG